MWRGGVILVCLLALHTLGHATDWTAQEGGSTDYTGNVPDCVAWGLGSQQTFNYGAGTPVSVGTLATPLNGGLRSFLKYDMTSLPAGTVTAAKLTVNVTARVTPTAFSVYRIRWSDWTEGTGNGTATNDGITWNIYKASTNWTTAGCGDTTNDYDTTVAVTAITAPAGTGSFDITGLASMVTDAVTSRSSILHLFIRQDTDSGTTDAYWQFSTAEDGTAGNRPKLTVTYTPAGGGAAPPPHRLFISGIDIPQIASLATLP